MKHLVLAAGTLASILSACGVQGPSPRTSGTLEVRVSVTWAPRMGHASPAPQAAAAYPVAITRRTQSGSPFAITAKTNASGNVQFKVLEPGTYQIKVESPNPITVLTPLTGPTSATVQPGGITSVPEAVSASCLTCQ